MKTLQEELVKTASPGGEARIRWERILVPVDFTPASIAAVKFAVRLAVHDGSSLCLLHVVDWVSRGEDANLFYTPQEIGYQAERKMARLTRLLAPTTVPQRVLVQRGPALRCILETASLVQSDLILLTRHRRPFWQRFLSDGVCRQIVEQAPCHVLLVNAPSADQLDPTSWDVLAEVA